MEDVDPTLWGIRHVIIPARMVWRMNFALLPPEIIPGRTFIWDSSYLLSLSQLDNKMFFTFDRRFVITELTVVAGQLGVEVHRLIAQHH